MTTPRYRTLLGAALAAIFVSAAIAQTTSDDPLRLAATKGAPQAEQTQPSDHPSDKMNGQPDVKAPASDQAAKKTADAKSSKPAKQASKSTRQSIAALDPNEKAFREALRQCAKEPDQGQRDSCLDTAIDRFQRG